LVSTYRRTRARKVLCPSRALQLTVEIVVPCAGMIVSPVKG
jgi:hypothetical protein